ncbi:unnamed protein product, partial [Prorocentrum cordatum]
AAQRSRPARPVADAGAGAADRGGGQALRQMYQHEHRRHVRRKPEVRAGQPVPARGPRHHRLPWPHERLPRGGAGPAERLPQAGAGRGRSDARHGFRATDQENLGARAQDPAAAHDVLHRYLAQGRDVRNLAAEILYQPFTVMIGDRDGELQANQ